MTGDTNTNPTALSGLGHATEQVKAIEKAVGEAWQAILLQMQSKPVPFYQSIFLAPEYFFSNQRHANDRFYSKDVKQFIVSRLSALAKRYPKILIIPGTVLWKKSAYREGPIAKGFGIGFGPSPKNQSRANKTLARLATARANFQTDDNLPGWSHSGKFGRDDSDIGNEQNFYMPKYYLDNAKALNTQIAQNVAYIYKGDVVLKYHKAGNFKEVEGEADNIVFAPGVISGKFKVGAVSYGIEVCRDHCMEVLKQGGGSVNIQVIVSSYIPNISDGMVMSNGGVLVHSSTEMTSKNTNVDQIHFNDGKSKLVAAKRVGGCQLWVIDMDDAACGISRSTSENLTSVTLEAASRAH
jgi:hypothetical protein